MVGQATQAGGRATAGVGTAAATARTGGTRESATGWARANRRTLNVVGVGAIAFVLLWVVSGFWVALLGVALVALLEFGLGLLGGDQGAAKGGDAGARAQASVETDAPPGSIG
jgi:hypothetical protein